KAVERVEGPDKGVLHQLVDVLSLAKSDGETRERGRVAVDELGRRALIAGFPPCDEFHVPPIVRAPGWVAHSIQRVDATGPDTLRCGQPSRSMGTGEFDRTREAPPLPGAPRNRIKLPRPHWFGSAIYGRRDGGRTWSGSRTVGRKPSFRRTPWQRSRAPSSGARTRSSSMSTPRATARWSSTTTR